MRTLNQVTQKTNHWWQWFQKDVKTKLTFASGSKLVGPVNIHSCRPRWFVFWDSSLILYKSVNYILLSIQPKSQMQIIKFKILWVLWVAESNFRANILFCSMLQLYRTFEWPYIMIWQLTGRMAWLVKTGYSIPFESTHTSIKTFK